MKAATIESVMQDAWADRLGDRELRILGGTPMIAVAVGSYETKWVYEMVERESLPDHAPGLVAALDQVVERLVDA